LPEWGNTWVKIPIHRNPIWTERMKLPTYQFIAQIAAAFAVVASLALVAYELKQSRDLASAELTISVLALEMDKYELVMDVEVYNQALEKVFMDTPFLELSTMERHNLWRFYMMDLSHWELKHLLFENGLLVEGEWEATRNIIKAEWASRPYLTPRSGNFDSRRSAFAEEMMSIWEEWKAEHPDIYEGWQTELAAWRSNQAISTE
jgi:hypothetical protein